MKKLIQLLTIGLALSLSSCYDDSALWESVNDHETRIAKLETLCNQMNTNISSLQAIIEALEDKDYVTATAPIKENGREIGYTITFQSGKSITIYHGQDGNNGEHGKDGVDGQDGKDGHSPIIGVRQDNDGIYYWTLDGEWLLNSDAKKIKAQGTDGNNGEDGKNGQDGENGQDGITPNLKIEDDYWYVSYDNGQTWILLYKAVGENGKDGIDGDSFFESVTQDSDYVYLTLTDGTTLTVPKAKSEAVIVTLKSIEGNTVTFTGELKATSVDLKVTIYYGLNPDLTIYNSEGNISITEFGQDIFPIIINDLKEWEVYYYFVETVYSGTLSYTPVESFKTKAAPKPGDYIDEYGINHGQGIKINDVTWAPVNCGYHATDYKYGKLYQWGRKYGQGYDGAIWDIMNNYNGEYFDAVSPELLQGPVSLSPSQAEIHANKYYCNITNWLDSQKGDLWNSNSTESPVKTSYDPCPKGWRVPTDIELNELCQNKSTWIENEDGQTGYWFCGQHSYDSNAPKAFFPAAGGRDSDGRTFQRGAHGYYWSSSPSGHNASYLRFWDDRSYITLDRRVIGMSVRCVQDLSENTLPEPPIEDGENESDYIDEYGINHGQGIEIDGITWAPVNCGYHATNFKYGKLYQWGRRYGQGRSTDSISPELVPAPVTLANGQGKESINHFFYISSEPFDWIETPIDDLWGYGHEGYPIIAEYDPCPNGWRVPTDDELIILCNNKSEWTTNAHSQNGYWFCGRTDYSENVPQIFLPAGGSRSYSGYFNELNSCGTYWSSKPASGYIGARCFDFTSNYADIYVAFRGSGYSIRCVKE